MEQTRCNVFPDEEGRTFLPPGFSSWTSAQSERIRYFLIEFDVNYRSAKTNSEVKPSSMKSYLLGIQRGFSAVWGYKLNILEGPVFNSPQEGLTAVIDNKFSLQQASGLFTERHNVLSKEDLLLLYGSPLLSRDTPKSFQARLVFDVALITAMRPTALVNLTVSQFRNITLRGENVWRIREAVGSRSGASKTRTGGWKDASVKPLEVTVWNSSSLGGLLNVYRDIDDYLKIREDMGLESDRFLLGYNAKGTEFSSYFEKQHLGRNSFSKIVKTVCASLGISGTGVKHGMTTHGLRGTVTTLLVEAGHSDSSIAMRTGHCDPRSLKNYQNLQGRGGEKRQEDILGVGDKGLKRNGIAGTGGERGKVGEDVADGLGERCAKAPKVATSNGHGAVKDESIENDSPKWEASNGAPCVGRKGEGQDRVNGAAGLLTSIKSISGGQITINVTHRYR